MQKWEYKVVDVPDQGELNKLGSEGWELVAVAGTSSEYYIIKAFLKRPIPN